MYKTYLLKQNRTHTRLELATFLAPEPRATLILTSEDKAKAIALLVEGDIHCL